MAIHQHYATTQAGWPRRGWSRLSTGIVMYQSGGWNDPLPTWFRVARLQADKCSWSAGEIKNVETIAVGGRIRDIMHLRKRYGPGTPRKLERIARVKLENGNLRAAEVHWYEALGIGKKQLKSKRLLD